MTENEKHSNDVELLDWDEEKTIAEKQQDQKQVSAIPEKYSEVLDSEDESFEEIDKTDIIGKKIKLEGYAILNGDFGEYSLLLVKTSPDSETKITFVSSEIVIKNLKDFAITKNDLPVFIKLRKVERNGKPDYYSLK